jgi:uncharacterized Tic20 family protein
MDSNNVQQMQSTRKINLWSMILSIASWVALVLFYVVVGGAALATSTSDTYGAGAGVGIAAVLMWLLMFGISIANLVVKIIAAVKNNNAAIKQVYLQNGSGTSAGVLSILAIFFLGLIFSIIVFVQTKDVLNKEA